MSSPVAAERPAGDVVEIPIRSRRGVIAVAFIDASDEALISSHRWHLNDAGYAKAGINGKSVRMHRLILGSPPGVEIDHLNGNRLDNRRANLREATRALNAQNMAAHRDGSSRYRGVFWFARDQRWAVQVCLAGKKKHLGYFDDEEEAGAVAAAWRAKNMPFSEVGR